MNQIDTHAMYADYESGLSMAEVGAKWGICESAVSRRFKVAGLPRHRRGPRPGRPRRLTPRQRAVLNFIIRFKERNCGDSPTIREIMRGVGIPSTSSVNYTLGVLEKHGHIVRPDSTQASRIEVPHGRWVYEP
jgi:hypothetical protein